ncbi:MAG: polysaccharide pyruvyl transferase family protein [Gammaproteobacteria bacterium]|nr:polysaccharide pyruvyl transferase family protein [Gammaproteobacteria bacterium]
MNVPKNPLFVLAGNGPYANKGCEAIVRGTVEILKKCFENPRFIIVSHFSSCKQFDEQCSNETNASITHLKKAIVKRYNFAWWLRQFNRIFQSKLIAHYPYKSMDKAVKDAVAVLSIGGDNYSLYYAIPDLYMDLNNFVKERGKPLIIWGASVGPFDENPAFEEIIIPHLRMVDGIFARETVTESYLEKKGVVDNVYRVADPAVMMKAVIPENHKIPFSIPEGCIGINLSPLMAKYVCNGNMEEWVVIASNTISLILNNVDNDIVLVPHVVNPGNNDYEFLVKVKNSIKIDYKRLFVLPPSLTAAETKWIIGKMKVFAGARTHSTIAALSSCIPTLSFAYSIKAIGINRQFYGHLRYCINPEEINPEYVLSVIMDLIKNSNEVRAMLKETAPKIQNLAMNAGVVTKMILGKSIE